MRAPARIAAAVLAAAWLTGCAALAPSPPTSPEARAALEATRAFNAEVRTFKGTGTIETIRDGVRQVGRMAWVGKVPAHLRASLLDPAGRPLMTLVVDGETVAARSGDRSDDYRAWAPDPSLERVLGIPIRAREAIRLLSGRVPRAGAHTVVLDGDRLRYLDRWNRVLQVVELDPATRRPRAVERFAGDARRFRAEFGPFDDGVDGMFAPTRIAIIGPAEEGARFDLRVDRFWPNQSLPAGAFRLEASE